MSDDIDPTLAAIHARTRTIYDRAAAGYDQRRAKVLFEKPWLDRFLATLPKAPSVLDVGCGAGEPIARCLIESGANVTGIDMAPGMLAIVRERFPERDWIEADMRNLDLGTTFDGVVSWDAFFHLSRDEQRATIPLLARHVAPGGALMLTIGPDESEATGTVEGEVVYHASLSSAEYEAILKRCGFASVAFGIEDPDCDFHSIVLATARM